MTPERRRRRAAGSLAAACLCAAVSAPRPARAQLRWDAGGEVGAVERFTAGAGGRPPRLGPIGELYADVALVPMVRLGARVSHDIAPATGLPARQITEAGVQIKLSPPLLPFPWHAWAFAGVGYARAYEPSHAPAGQPLVPGLGGGFVDAPFGLALGYKVDRAWEPFVELGARFGGAFGGALYDTPQCLCAADPGRDVFAVSLSLGLNSNQ